VEHNELCREDFIDESHLLGEYRDYLFYQFEYVYQDGYDQEYDSVENAAHDAHR